MRQSQPLPHLQPGEIRRIGIFRPGLIGDLVLAVPGLRALRNAFPGAEITLIAQPWAADLAERFSCVDRVLPLQELPWDWESPSPGGDDDIFLQEAVAYRYDLVLQLHADASAAARFALALGARITAGFCRDEELGGRFQLLLPMLEGEPEVFRVMKLAHALGGVPRGVHLEYPLLPRDLEEIQEHPALAAVFGQRPLVVLHPGARPPSRRWPLERFAAVANLLQETRRAAVVLVGGAEEVPLVEKVREGMEGYALNLAGKLSLGGLAALLTRADLFVGNDSGPAQLAAAVAPRSLRIFGPANRGRWAPLDRSRDRVVYREVECSPCGYFECPIDHRCLAWITLEEVMAEVDGLLEEANSE